MGLRVEGSSRMRLMVKFVRENISRLVTRQGLARQFSLTPEHINTIFKKELGVTPTQFVQREEALLALRLIRDEGLSVKEVAARVGFTDEFYFSKVFKKVMHVSPGSLK